MSFYTSILKTPIPTTTLPILHHLKPSLDSHLVLKLTLSSPQKDLLDLVSYSARFCASKHQLVTDPVLHLKPSRSLYTALVSPFVHAKTKQVFSKTIYHHVLQIYDASDAKVQQYLDFFLPALPPGCDVELSKFEYRDLDHAEYEFTKEKDSFDDQVKEKMQAFLEKFQK